MYLLYKNRSEKLTNPFKENATRPNKHEVLIITT